MASFTLITGAKLGCNNLVTVVQRAEATSQPHRWHKRQVSPPWTQQNPCPVAAQQREKRPLRSANSRVINLAARINNSWNSWSVGPGPARRGEAGFNHSTTSRGGEGSRFEGQEGGSTVKIFPVLGLQIYKQQLACVCPAARRKHRVSTGLLLLLSITDAGAKVCQLARFLWSPVCCGFGHDSVPWDFQVVSHPNTRLAQDCSAPSIRCAQPSAPGSHWYNHIETHRSKRQEPAQRFKTITH